MLATKASEVELSSEAFAVGAVEGSRTAILEQMQKLGVHTEALESLTITQLSDLLYGMNKLANSPNKEEKKRTLPKQQLVLSSVDKSILKALLQAEGRVSTVSLSRDLKIPFTTLQRRRKKLDSLLRISYSLNYEKIKMKQVTFLISTEGRDASKVRTEILSIQGICRLEQVLGNGIDLRVDTVLKTNEELASLCEQIKRISGVRSVIWMESLHVIEDYTNNERNVNLLIDSI